MEQKPVLDVKSTGKMVIFKYTTFVRDVWINSACSVLTGLNPSVALISSGLER